MGRFSTTVQIKNNIDRSSFINSFCDVMKKRGFVPCVENEAALSYALAFSEDGWVTLASEDYRDNPKKAQDDLKYLADGFKTSAFSVEVVDSDFAILSLNSGDTVIVGDGSGYGIEDPSRGNRKYWESLLASGKAWEQFTEIVEKNSTFVEETLSELAVVLGILPEHICADFSELSDSENVALMYFKKAAAKEKAMTLNAAFKQVFGEALEPLGFKLIKSKYPYFVRLIGDEIIHVITCRKVNSNVLINYGKRFYAYEIVGGVATVYRAKIDLNKNPNDLFWLFSNCNIYTKQHPYDCDLKYRSEILEFRYNPEDYEQMKDSLNGALKITEHNLLPLFNTLIELEDCVDYYFNINRSIVGANVESIMDGDKGSECDESLIYFKISDYHKFINRKIEEAVSNINHEIHLRPNSYILQNYDEYIKKVKYTIGGIVVRLDGIANDSTMFEKVKCELQQRKKTNSEILKGYGLNL